MLLGLKLWHGAAPEIVPGFLGGGNFAPVFLTQGRGRAALVFFFLALIFWFTLAIGV